MLVLRFLPAIVSFLLLGAHFFRADLRGLAIACAIAPLLLLWRERWVRPALQVLLVAGAAVWVRTAYGFAAERAARGAPWLRMAIILGAVTLFTLLAAWLLRGARSAGWFREGERRTVPVAAAFLLTFTLLAIIQIKVARPMLLADRFAPGSGWVEALVLSFWGAFLANKMLDRMQTPRWRTRAWLAFSGVFFGQLALGLAGFPIFLMSGKLHPPVPAVIVGGPVFRGEGYFMLILFAATLIFVGPAWCSHLCYIGAWDDALARTRKRAQALPRWRHALRAALLVLVIAAAWALRAAGATPLFAGLAALAFGLFGVALMLTWSRRTGTMTHCSAFCPIGLLATTAGKVSPFRLRIGAGCTDCNACTIDCRYDALSPEDVKRGRPNYSCTLCGDCLASCRGMYIDYTFPGLSPKAARGLFIVLVSALNAVCLGVARI